MIEEPSLFKTAQSSESIEKPIQVAAGGEQEQEMTGASGEQFMALGLFLQLQRLSSTATLAV